MARDDDFDADEILRDVDEATVPEVPVSEDDMKELEFGSKQDQDAHFKEIADELGEDDNLWQ
jgi:hypothetical protein